MSIIKVVTNAISFPADIHTPVAIYLRLRDVFRDTVLLESAEYQNTENSYSFIAVNAIAGVSVQNNGLVEIKLPNERPERFVIDYKNELQSCLQNFLNKYSFEDDDNEHSKKAQGLYGYLSYESVPFFENISFSKQKNDIPCARYRLYQYVIVFNHFKNEMIVLENKIAGLESKYDVLVTQILSKDIPEFPFSIIGEEKQNQTINSYENIIEKGIEHCLKGNVFQVVLSRSFSQKFNGDEFNVYRALRSINPSPYMFYFDYGDYKLIGSSPEAQLKIENNIATVHAIAGTVQRQSNDVEDNKIIEHLKSDTKENREHIMLVDLARNDLSKYCKNVMVNNFKQVQKYSHVIHLVSEITGVLKQNYNSFEVLGNCFPAGTLSGAPKHKAMQIIDELESDGRCYYAGTIGFIGANGSCNHAIMIRTILSKQNELFYQAGAGVVALSNVQEERKEVDRKLGAIRKSIELSSLLNNSKING